VVSLAVRAVAVLLAAVVLALSVLWALQRRLVYFPAGGPLPAAGSVVDGARDVVLRTSDGLELGAWLVPGRGRAIGVTVLVANGNGGNRLARAELADALADRGLSVLLFDYRGYGGNPGEPSEEGLARDVRAARSFLVDQEGVPPDRLLYLGESLGAAVVTELAAVHPPAGLVLRSPFEGLAEVGRHHYRFLPVEALLKDRYPLVRHLREVEVPVVVVLGSRDSVVPPEQSRAVAAAAPRLSRLVEVPGAEHNDLSLVGGEALAAVVADLAEEVSPPGTRPQGPASAG
jgi:pimeloyl-ACP methyl ester carboxylesterase